MHAIARVAKICKDSCVRLSVTVPLEQPNMSNRRQCLSTVKQVARYRVHRMLDFKIRCGNGVVFTEYFKIKKKLYVGTGEAA